MIHTLAHRYAKWIVTRTGTNENYDILVYGSECLISETLANLVLFSLAAILHIFLPTLIWLVAFLLCRLWFGGFHAKSHFWCILYSTALGLLCGGIVVYISELTGLLLFEIVLGLYVAFRIAPVVHPNHPISNRQRTKFTKRARFFAVLESALILFLLIIHQNEIAHLIGLGLLSSAVFSILGKYTNPRLTHKD